MRRTLAFMLGIVAGLAWATPATAQVPAPKVTINGLVDFVSSAYRNWTDVDVTDDRDRGWYSRERGVFTLTGEVGRSKAVWAVELDFTNGAGLNNAGNAFNGGLNGRAFPATSANFDLDTDVASVVETKWLYVETPVTGPGSLLPFIPVTTVLRAGAQPARGHDYKLGMLLSGDIPGVALETTWSPNVRSTLTFVQIGEAIDRLAAPGQKESWATVGSVEIDVFKGLTVKPTYAYASYDGGNCGSLNQGMTPRDGFNPNACGTAVPSLFTRRHTLGGDLRWRSGPFTLEPTFYYQFGEQEVRGVRGGQVDIAAWIFDTLAGYRTGPLTLQARFMYTSGMPAQQRVQNGADVAYYQPINSGFVYMFGFTDIQTAATVDYINSLFGLNATGLSLWQSQSYDKYGRIFLALAADYALTPALTLRGVINASWTPEKVDTDGCLSAVAARCGGAANTLISVNRGDSRFLGTELNAGLTYRFAPNVSFDVMGAYMFAGDALDHAATLGGPRRSAEDVYKLSTRVRVTF